MSKSQASNRLPRPSRRAFLKTSTTAIGLAGGLSLRRGAHAAGDDTLKVGLIGCGGRGSGAAVNIMNAGPEVKLVAMADLFEDKVKGSRERLKKIKPDQVQVDDDHCFAEHAHDCLRPTRPLKDSRVFVIRAGAMRAHPCSRCFFRSRHDRNPKSLLGRLWRWHIAFCPGWKKYLKTLSSEERAELEERYALGKRS